MNTRNFREELQEWADTNITSEGMKAIVEKIHETLVTETPRIIAIDTYFLMDGVRGSSDFKIHGFQLYFVIHESIWGATSSTPKTLKVYEGNKAHMVMPIFDNPNFTAKFLDKSEWLDEESLKGNFMKQYLHPIIAANV